MLADTEEYRRIKPKKEEPDKEIKRARISAYKRNKYYQTYA